MGCYQILKGYFFTVMDTKVKFLPFHAINEFMLDDYRQLVIQSVLGRFNKLNEEKQRRINSLIKRYVKVQGFRNSALAPLPMKVNGCIDAFKKSPEFVGLILSSWYELHLDLAALTSNLLESNGWKILPLDADRSVLPGFMIEWPKQDDFESLIQSFRDNNQELNVSDDDISLMIVWVSNRLPYDHVENLFKENKE